MMIPLGISGGFQVMVMLNKEDNGVMTSGPGTGERRGKDHVNLMRGVKEEKVELRREKLNR